MSFKKEIKKLSNELKGVEDLIQKDIQNVEGWMIERKKFLIISERIS